MRCYMRALHTARARRLRSLPPAACHPPPATRRARARDRLPLAHVHARPACNPVRPATQPATRAGATPALDVLDAHLAASGRSYLAGAEEEV